MSKQDRLGGMLEEVEQPLSAAIKAADVYTDWLDEGLQLTFPHCGLATLALRLYLSQHSIHSERAMGLLSGKALKSDGGPYHVVLHVDDIVVDPTYCQFFGLVGLDARLANHFTQLRHEFPERKIAYFHRDKAVDFGQSIGMRALSMRQIVSTGQYRLPATLTRLGAPKPPLAASHDSLVVATYRSIWRTDFRTTEIDDPYGLEIARGILDTMT